MARGVKIKTKDEFAKTVRVAHEAIHDAIDDSIKAGADTAQTTLDRYAVERAYEDLNVNMGTESSGMKGKFFTASAISEKWGTDPWYLRFFEYGTEYIQAMPFVRPGAKVMKKTFDKFMKEEFEVKIKSKVHVGHS